MAVYKVGADGKAQSGLSVGDEVVTAAGTYTISAVNPDGTYKSSLTNKGQTTSNYTGSYSQVPATTAPADTGSSGASSGGSATPTQSTQTSAKTAPEGFTGSATSVGTNNMTQSQIKDKMNANSVAWWSATTQEEKDRLHAENELLASMLGGSVSYDSATGVWSGDAAQEVKKQQAATIAGTNISGINTNYTPVEGTNIQGITAAQPNYSADDLLAKWQANMPNVDADAMVNQWKEQMPDVDKAKSDQLALLEQWKANLLEQSNNQIDYNVAKAITELERALEDAQPQYKEQQESISKDERQSMDNSALYAEMRGDKGGIGQEQYNSIQNTAAQNRLSVQQAQTKLATDTQRQIADLRAQGDFDKADAALEISQQYLSQLMSLEQWAFDAGMTAAQFKVTLDQWATDYKMAMAQFQTSLDQWAADYDFNLAQYQTNVDQWNKNFQLSQEQWNKDFAFNQEQYKTGLEQWNKEFQLGQEQWNKTFAYNQTQDGISNDLSYGQLTGTIPSTGQQTLNYQEYLSNQQLNQQTNLAQQGLYMAQNGLTPSSSQLAAMQTVYGYGQTEVNSIISAAKLAAQTGTSTGDYSVQDYDSLFADAKASGNPQSYIANNYKKYGFSSSSGLYSDYKSWLEDDGDPAGYISTYQEMYNLGLTSEKDVMDYLKKQNYNEEERYEFWGYYQDWLKNKSSEGGNNVKEMSPFDLKSEDAKYIYALMKVGGFDRADIENKLASADITEEEFEYMMYLLECMFYVNES